MKYTSPEFVVLLQNNMQPGQFSQQKLDIITTAIFAEFDQDPVAVLSTHKKMAEFLVAQLYRKYAALERKNTFAYTDILRASIILRFALSRRMDQEEADSSPMFTKLLAMQATGTPIHSIKDIPTTTFYVDYSARQLLSASTLLKNCPTAKVHISPYTLALQQMYCLYRLWERSARFAKTKLHSTHVLNGNMIELVVMNSTLSFADFLDHVNARLLAKAELQDPQLIDYLLKFPLFRDDLQVPSVLFETKFMSALKLKYATTIFTLTGSLAADDKSETALALRAEARRLIAKDPVNLTRIALRLLDLNKANMFAQYTTADNFSDALYAVIIQHLSASQYYETNSEVVKHLKGSIVGDARCQFQAKLSAALQSGMQFASSTLHEIYNSNLALYTTQHFLKQCEIFMTRFLGGCTKDQISEIAGHRRQLPAEVQRAIATINFANDQHKPSKATILNLIRQLNFILLKPSICKAEANDVATRLTQLITTADYLGTNSIVFKIFGKAEQKVVNEAKSEEEEELSRVQVICSDLSVTLVRSKLDSSKWIFATENLEYTEVIVVERANVSAAANHIIASCRDISDQRPYLVDNGLVVSEFLISPVFAEVALGNTILRRSYPDGSASSC